MDKDGWLTEVLKDAADRVSQWNEWEKPEMLRTSSCSQPENEQSVIREDKE